MAWRDVAFRLLAFAFVIAAGMHAASLAGWRAADDSPAWRHALFVAVDLAGVWYLVARPVWALPLFMLLVLQQYWGHGGRLLRWWMERGAIDWQSLFVVAGLTGAFFLLVAEGSERGAARAARAAATPATAPPPPAIASTDTPIWIIWYEDTFNHDEAVPIAFCFSDADAPRVIAEFGSKPLVQGGDGCTVDASTIEQVRELFRRSRADHVAQLVRQLAAGDRTPIRIPIA